jgi:hypothetical protein
VFEQPLHEVLESVGGVEQTKSHEEVLKQAERKRKSVIFAMSWATISI